MTLRGGIDGRRTRPSPLLLLFLVLCNVALQVLSAALVKYSSGIPLANLLALGLVVFLILVLNFSRFIVWGEMHKRYPLSIAYPATALFFPCLVALAYSMGERVTAMQWTGAGLVTAGVLWLVASGGDAET